MRSPRAAVRRIVDFALDKVGFRLLNKSAVPHELGLDSALTRLGFAAEVPIGTVIDVGASDGRWSRVVMRHFPRARYLLIDANRVHEAALQRFCAEHPNAEYALTAAGGRTGELYFDARDPFIGVASETPPAFEHITVPVTTVDEEVRRRGLPPPYLLKLDTHGFEVPILEGARKTLEQTNLAVIEAYNFKLMDGCLRFHELCGYLDARGLRTIDLIDPMFRPDGVLWQLDLIFLAADRPQFRTNGFR
jgi:FkbM family methyltransferase